MWLEVYKASESAASVSVARCLRNQQHTTANCTSWHPTYPDPGQETPTTHRRFNNMDFETFSRDLEEPTKNTENRCFLDTAFVKFLLPTIRREVINELQAFLETYPNLSSPGGYRTFLRDPVKPTTKFYCSEERYPNNDTLPGVSSFANLYFETPQEFDLLDSEDIRKFLHIISRAGCFQSEQAYDASALKKLYDKFAHNASITYLDKIDAYHLVKKMLKSFPNTSQYLEDLEVAWIYGVRHFLEDKEDPRDDYIQELKSEIVKLRLELCDIYYSDEEEIGIEKEMPEKELKPPAQVSTVSYSSVAKKGKVHNRTHPVRVEKVEDKKVDDGKVYQKLEFNKKFSPDIQVMFGPIPGKLEYKEVYDTMKRFFGTIGEVQNQYLERETHFEGNNKVRHGVVVFKRKKDAATALNKEFMLLKKIKIKLYKH